MRIESIKTLLIGFLAFIISLPVFAYDFTDNGIYFNLKSDGTLEVVGLATRTTRADILSDVTINGKTYRVTSIGEHAFAGRSDITYLSIPWSVTSIGEYAFIDCGSNMTVNIADPESWCEMRLGNEHSSPLSSAGRVLVHDIETTNIIIPAGVTSISNFTFYQCRSITSLNIPSSVSSIGSSAFEDCTGLTSVSLSDGLKLIGGSAFEGCKNLSTITIPSTVTAIFINAFKNCTNLNAITSEIQQPFAIDGSIFSTYSTATLTVPYGTKAAYQSTAGWNNFSRITDGTSDYEFVRDDITYHITSSSTVEVKSVNEGLKRVTIPESVYYNNTTYQVTALAERAFEGRDDMTYLSIPNCGSNIVVNIDNLEAWCKVTLGNKHSSPLSSAKEFHINGSEVRMLTIPDGVTSIPRFAFYQCRSITSLLIPSSVTSIGSSAFEDCTGLTFVSLSYGLTSIGGSSFEGCKFVSSITIPGSVTSIAINAFKNCTSLNTITSEIQNPFAIDESVFSTYSTATLNVPRGTKNAYQSTSGWNKFANIVAPKEGGEIGETFESGGIYCTIGENNTVSVTSGDVKYSGDVVIPEQVTYNGKTYNVTTISNGAFESCIGLLSVTIPSSIKIIDIDAFKNCINLTAVNTSDISSWCNINFVDHYCNPLFYANHLFLNGTEITKLNIPTSISRIKSYSFQGCSDLISVTIPDNVTSIGDYAFGNCNNLKTVILENLNPFRIDESTFSSAESDIYASATLVVPTGTKAAYQATEGWNKFHNIVEDGGVGFKFEADGIYYIIDKNNTVSVTSGDVKYSGDIVIPEQVTYKGKTYSVTSIGGKAFFGCTGLINVAIPNSVTKIHYSAFEGCSGLTSITIPNSIKEIWDNAFEGCVNLTAVYISDLKAWLSIWYEEGSPVPFYSSPLYYAGHLFLNGTEIKDLVIPPNITSIGAFGFLGCIGLTSVTIPNSVTSIGYYAFSYCNSLTTIVSEIEKPFKIYNGNFSDDTYKNAELIVPKGTKVLYEATEGWNNFSNILEAGEGGKIDQIIQVDRINYKIGENNTMFVTYSGGSKSGGTYYPNGGDLVIHPQITYNGITYAVTSIEDGAFDLSIDITIGGITSITIPSSIQSIGSEAFAGQLGLISVHITDLATWCKIDFHGSESNPLLYAHHMFLNDQEITDLKIPSSVPSIGSYAFAGGKYFTSMTIPNSVTSIGQGAFQNCNELMTIVSEIVNPFAIDASVFGSYDKDIYASATLIVPNDTKAAYQATEGWNQFAKITEPAEKDEPFFTIDGVTYQGSKSEKNVVVKSVDTGKTWMQIPASVSYDGITYQVTGIDNDVFKGSSMAALIWDVEAALPNNAFSNASIGPNFMLYVKSSSYAPSSVKNVVVNGTAQTIVLSDDGGQFYCPQAFTARRISYTHNYSMETGKGSPMGWESIALPFDVQRVIHSTQGEIVPFAAYSSGSNQKPFWLAYMSASGFKRTADIRANEAYIIAMPNNNGYLDDYILAGDVTFSAENITVPKTPAFNGTFLPAFSLVAKSSSVYALNVNNRYVRYSGSEKPGSIFIRDLRDVRPFEAYMTGSSSRGIIEINFDDGTTDMLDILYSTDESREVTIHTLSGQQVIRTTQREFDAVWQQLPKGVYIVNGKKMIK